MKKILITILVTLGTQGVVGSEMRVLDGNLSTPKPTERPPGYFGDGVIVAEVCFDKKLFVNHFMTGRFVAFPGYSMTPVMENTPQGISQKRCEHQVFTIFPGGITKSVLRKALGRKSIVNEMFKLCISDAVFYFSTWGKRDFFIQAFTDGRAETC